MRARSTRLLTFLSLTVLGAVGVLVSLPRVEVEGRSMLPALRPGDRLVVVPRVVSVGALVCLRDPRQHDRMMVKRVVAVGANAVEVEGDNRGASTDSRHFGPVDRSLVVGRPVYRYAPPDRAGWLLWLA